MDLPNINAKYIKQLNDNMEIIEKNIQTVLTFQKEHARDFIALQKAVIQFLTVKGVITSEEDFKLFQKLHLQNIAYLDQELAKRRDENIL